MSRNLSCLAAILMVTLAPVCTVAQLTGSVSATNQFEYSYSSESEKEIFENWLDVSYLLGDFRTGLMFNSQQPSEEGFHYNGVRHLFFEFSSGPFNLRVGTFYGLFGRGLIFAAYEDRLVRVDNSLEGIIVSGGHGRLEGTVFSGHFEGADKDVRAMDLNFDLGGSWLLGGTGLTYDSQTSGPAAEKVNREWVASARLSKFFSWSDFYFEHGIKTGYDFLPGIDNEKHDGYAYYGSANLYLGPISLSMEGKDYWRYAVLPRDDGKPPLNNPPACTREHVFALLGRDSHQIDPDDEVGGQAEVTITGPLGLSLIGNANRTENHDGDILFEELYGQMVAETIGPFRMIGAYGYQDVRYEGKGIHTTYIGDLTWFLDDTHSVEITGEFQYTTLGSTVVQDGILDLGSYWLNLFIVEFAIAPKWTFSAILEQDNKRDVQRISGEKKGPFPAFQVSYTSPFGGTLTCWAGKRQAGQICVGGVCKNEPAFEGMELFGIIRF